MVFDTNRCAHKKDLCPFFGPFHPVIPHIYLSFSSFPDVHVVFTDSTMQRDTSSLTRFLPVAYVKLMLPYNIVVTVLASLHATTVAFTIYYKIQKFQPPGEATESFLIFLDRNLS